jgi:hypothetical protein
MDEPGIVLMSEDDGETPAVAAAANATGVPHATIDRVVSGVGVEGRKSFRKSPFDIARGLGRQTDRHGYASHDSSLSALLSLSFRRTG